jgi:ligand-binding SRPBCC domain-containing protein
MRFHFQTEQWLPYSVETAFAFFADPANLPRLMPAWQHARIDDATFISPPPPPHPFPGSDTIKAGNGTRLTITARALPFLLFRSPWIASIEDFRWLEGFCDVQLSGPFKYWRHCHTLQQDLDGTRLRDHVEYEPPLGPLGTIANVLFIRAALSATFRLRHKRTLELLAQRHTPATT